MTDRSWIQPIVERVVAQALETHTTQLRSEIVSGVMEQVAAQPPEAPPASTSSTGDLARAVAEIQLGSSQKEILKALLDNSARYASRIALFVVRGGNATGWQARGFQSSDALKDFALDVHAPAVARAIGDRAPAGGPASDLDTRFTQQVGAPSGEGRFLPLVLKDKVAALVYADGGTDAAGQLDGGSLELLVLATSAWLEVNSLRKLAHKEPGSPPAENRPAPPAAEAAAPQFNDPFASHVPTHAMAAAASAEAGSVPVMTTVEPEPVAVEELAPAVAPVPVVSESAPAEGASPEEQEVHRKAQRFARLLIDEVKLYNQAKVTEGRKHKDMYDRLKEAIEKSRSTYHKRYGNTVAASGNYFQHELIRSLAEDDVSIMGTNFPH